MRFAVRPVVLLRTPSLGESPFRAEETSCSNLRVPAARSFANETAALSLQPGQEA